MSDRVTSPYRDDAHRGRPIDGRAPRAPSPPGRSKRPADYTLGHGGRQVRLGPIAFWTIVGALSAMTAWSLGTASYFAFREDLLTRLISRQAQMQYGYEDRIAELRAQVDRLASRQLLDQEQYEQKLDQLVRRQSVLETRAAALSNLPDQMPTGSIRPTARPPIGERAPPPKPSPINDTVIPVAPPDREARLESRTPAATGLRLPAGGGIEAILARLQGSLDRVEARQMSTLNTLEENYDARARRIRRVLGDLGLEVAKLPAGSPPRAVGGPFVPAKLGPENAAFERQLLRISAARGQVDRLTRALATVPVRRPVPGEIDTTSGFGMRVDPFLHVPAMHTGVDFRGEIGEAIRATATGTVTHTGWSGGYGKMVEIDHGNGLSTRYGHLSSIEVEVGQSVRTGQIVGRLGSTGRSTGPHLHYETRMDGEAVDPQRFLRAGLRLGELL
ncbi:MAG TPA: M23 family metallopeptidase [Xanthobacteraceae bacterium]|nr:M23 family metallopeptidase [Xanthobacteraceae bacterium]